MALAALANVVPHAVGTFFLSIFTLLAFTTKRAFRTLSDHDKKKLDIGITLSLSIGDYP